MTQEIVYQNREIDQPNPLAAEESSSTAPVQDSKKDTQKSPPADPKIKILLFLGILIIVLFLISFIIAQVRTSSQKNTPLTTPTPVTVLTPAPTDIPQTSIPDELKSQFDQIDTNNQTEIDFSPPQFDTTVGEK